MKKILLTLGIIASTQSAFAINPDSPVGQAMVRRGMTTCVAEMVYKNIWTTSFSMKYCGCVMRDFVSQMTVKELELYGNDDPEIEVKANKILDKASEKCMEALSE